jgi:hypothetical protein
MMARSTILRDVSGIIRRRVWQHLLLRHRDPDCAGCRVSRRGESLLIPLPANRAQVCSPALCCVTTVVHLDIDKPCHPEKAPSYDSDSYLNLKSIDIGG